MRTFALTKTLSDCALILLWTYTGLDKLLRYEESRKAFHNQTFPPELAELLSGLVPLSELALVVFLLVPVLRWWGHLGSLLLLTVFLTYIGLIWVGAFPRVPCNCAGILESLDWSTHFWLNLGFIFLSVLGLKNSTAQTKQPSKNEKS